MASPAPPAMREIFLADELLEEIFLRLHAAADLARASTACASFRRVITDTSFLRRFRSLHRPPLLGFLYDDFHPAEPAHPSASAARALARAADFTFSFLPPTGHWRPRDSRDGRILLVRLPADSISVLFGVVDTDSDGDDDHWGSDKGNGISIDYRNVVTDLAVCDPLSRRYIILPPIHDDLTASGEQERLVDFEPFLAPAGEEEEEMDETSFRVVARVQYEDKLVAFVFSSRTGQWRGFEFDGWSALAKDASSLYGSNLLCRRHYAHGCFYWMLNWMDKVLVLDTRRMEFSTAGLSRGEHRWYTTILEAEEDSIGFFTLRRDSSGAYQLCYTIRGIKAEGANVPQLDLDKTIPLPLD